VTAVGSPVGDAIVGTAGHVSAIAGGVDGPDGVPLQAAAALTHKMTMAKRRS
jgi:hypothetical protein